MRQDGQKHLQRPYMPIPPTTTLVFVSLTITQVKVTAIQCPKDGINQMFTLSKGMRQDTPDRKDLT